eukprot:XP_001199325.2 PREDICTED: uncharacterized protein LOC763378 isoform X2 [Strongylocentrotus purpuratus]
MSGSVRQGSLTNRGSFRLSPNEEAAVLKEERDRRRKLRLKQVREQDRLFAKQLLVRTKAKKEAEVTALSVKLEEEWKAVQKEKQEALKEIYEQCLSKVGDGHREAKNQKPLDEERAAAALRNTRAAKQRHQAAILKESAARNESWQKENAHIISRKNALEVEKVRASHIANLPPPKRDPLADLDLQKPPVMVTRVEGFSTTHYHIPGEYVERAEPHEQDDARQAGKEEDERLRGETERLQAELKERQEKAVLRHKHAKGKELLKQDYERLLLDLSDLQNADRRRRQAVVADIPRQVFQPPHKRLEDKAEKQHQLEEAFEDMYMKHTDYAGDITLALEPKVPGQDTDLDLTADTTRNGEDEDQEVTLERPGLTRENQGFTQYPTMSAEATQGPRPDDGTAQQKTISARAEMLKRLMGRVRGQQDDWKKQQTKAQTPVASGQPRVIPESHAQEEEIATYPESEESESHVSIETTPTQTLTTPSELSEHPIESGETSSTTTSSMPRSLETGTLSEVSSEAGSTLLHPMEYAARLRGEQLAQQARTQEDIRAIGEEQQKRLGDLKQTIHVPWDTIAQSQWPSIPPEQYRKGEFTSERRPGVADANLVPGISGYPTPGASPGKMLQSGVPVGDLAGTNSRRMDSAQTQRVLNRPQYEPQIHRPLEYPRLDNGTGRGPDGQPRPGDDTDGLLLMQRKPTVVEKRIGVQSTPSDSDIGSDQVIDLQLLDEVVHDVPGTMQQTLYEESAVDWLQRAREYQQRLLDRQKQSQDSLLHAQTKLQERRDRLMTNYPDVKLPDYVPYTMQGEMDRTEWPSTQQFTGSLAPVVGEFQGERSYYREGEESTYDRGVTFEPGNSRGQQTLTADISSSASSEEAIGYTGNRHHVGYEETLEPMGSSRVSPSKRRLGFFHDQDTRDSRFAPMAEEAVSQTSAEGSVNLSLERKSDIGDNGVSYLQDTVGHAEDSRRETEAEKALTIRHQQLLEEKRVLEERQNAQQLRLIQKQKELADQIEQQQRKYQERKKAAKVSPSSKGPPPEHSPSIPQGILRGSGVGSHSPGMQPSTGQYQSSSGMDFGRSLSQQMDMRRMLQGQVFKPQDFIHHLQASQSMGLEQEDESDVSHQSSSRASGGTQELGNMMMGVLKPHELLPHLQNLFTDSDGSLPDNVSSSSSGLIQEQSLRGLDSAEQGTRSFDGGYSHSGHLHSSGLSEGTLDMDSTASTSLQHARLAGGRLQGQVFRPADLMAELRAINLQVGTQGSFGSSNEFTQSKSGEWRSTFKSGTLSGSEGPDTRSGPYQLPGSLHGQTALSEQSTGISYHSSQGTSELSGASRGPKGVYTELLQGHVFRPEDLLPHLQNPLSLSQILDGSSMPEPHLSSTLAHSDTYASPYTLRPEGDGGGSYHRDDDVVQAASPDLDDRDPIQYDQPPVSTFLPMTMPSHPAPGSHFMRSRRPPPANLQQVAMLPENMGPHELSTILEMETSADERMHLYGVGATPRNVMESSRISRADETAAPLHYLSGTEGNLGERLPTFGGPATAGVRFQGSQRMDMDRSDTEWSQGTLPGMQAPNDSRGNAGSVIQISQPTVASLEAELYSTQEMRTPHLTSDLQARDMSVAASTLSEHTLEDESVVNVSAVGYFNRHTDGQGRSMMGESFGSYGADINIGSLGVHRGEPAGESMRWKDLLKSSDDSVTSSSSDGVERGGRDPLCQPVPAGDEAEEFFPMMEMENTTMATQDSMHDHSYDAKDGTGTHTNTHREQLGAMRMQKHLAAGLNLDSSSSSNGQNNGNAPRTPSQEESTPSSSSKLSTVIGAAVGGASSGRVTDEDDSPLFVPKSSQQQEQFHFLSTDTQRDRMEQGITEFHGQFGRVLPEQHSEESFASTSPGQRQPEPPIPFQRPYKAKDLAAGGSRQGFFGDQDIEIAASQEEYIRDMLASLQHGRQRGTITMPLFSDVSLSGYSMSQDGSVSEMRSPVKGREMTSLESTMDPSGKELVQQHLALAGASYPEDRTFPSLGDLEMETGILEEPDLTFASSFNTTADSTLQAPGVPAPAGVGSHEQQEPSTLDISQSSQGSASMSLLSFQHHENELLEASPQSFSRVTRSEGQLRVTQSLTSTTRLRVTQSVGHVKVVPQTTMTSQQEKDPLDGSRTSKTGVTRSEGQVKDPDRAAGGGPVSLQEAFQQRKTAFIQASESRKREVKEHAETRSQESTVFAKTIQDWKRSKVKGQTKQAAVKKASGSKTGQFSADTTSGLSSTLKTRTDRNAGQKEMKERSLRLYSQLEEVKKQKTEKDRQDSYAANRQKKKEFEQKLQAKRMKRTSSLEKTKKDK